MGKASKKAPPPSTPSMLRTDFPLLAADVDISGSLLLVGGGGGGGNNGVPNAIKVCELTEENAIEELKHHSTAADAVTSLSLDPEGQHVACLLGKDIVIYRLDADKEESKEGSREGPKKAGKPRVKIVEAQRISLNSEWLMARGASVAEAQQPYCLKLGGYAQGVAEEGDAEDDADNDCPSFCPFLAVGMEDGGLLLFKRDSIYGKFRGLWRQRLHQKDLKQISFSADGELIATAAADGKCLLWTLREGGELEGTPKEMSKAPLGGKAAEKGQWRVVSLPPEQPKGGDAMLAAVNTTARGPGLAVRCCTVRRSIIKHVKVSSSPVTALGASPDAELLAYGDSEGTVTLLHGPTLRQLVRVPVHPGWFITRVLVVSENLRLTAASPDEPIKLKMITCAGDNTCRLVLPGQVPGFYLAMQMISNGALIKRVFLALAGVVLAVICNHFIPETMADMATFAGAAWDNLTGSGPAPWAGDEDEWAVAAKGPDKFAGDDEAGLF